MRSMIHKFPKDLVMQTSAIMQPVSTPVGHVNSNQLVKTVLAGKDPALRKSAWMLLLRKEHTLSTYTDVIDRSPDAEIRIHAWELFKQSDVSFPQLLYLIKWSHDAVIRHEAWEKASCKKLLAVDLVNVISSSKDVIICNDAGRMLKEILKFKANISQENLIKKVAEAVLNNHLVHSKKRVYSLIIDHAFCLDKHVRRMSKRTNPKIAAYAALPAYAYLFYGSEEKVKMVLKEFIS